MTSSCSSSFPPTDAQSSSARCYELAPIITTMKKGSPRLPRKSFNLFNKLFDLSKISQLRYALFSQVGIAEGGGLPVSLLSYVT